MSWISDALTVLVSQWSALLRILAVFSVGGLLTFGLLRRTLREHLDTTETFLLALAGWPLGWVLAGLLGFLINRWIAFGPGWAAFLLAVFGLLLLPGWKKIPAPWGRFSWLLLALLLAFLASLLTRLAFLTDLLTPSYFDGALHYEISRYLLTHFGMWPWQALDSLSNNYYHIGFHLLVASWASVTQLDIMQVILLAGQLLLATLPFPVFLVMKRETGSLQAGFFALILAGWGWNMPAHALNWGKYPALAGLLALQFALALVFMLTRSTPDTRIRFSLLALFGVAVVAATLTHTRSLVVIFIVLLGFLAARVWENLSGRLKWPLLVALAAGLVGVTVYIESRGILNLVFDPYLRAGRWMTWLVVALSPFAFRRFERLSMTGLLSLFLLLACLLLPLPGAIFQTPLDRPFVQMALYLPLALLGGLGLAGLRAEPFKGWVKLFMTVAVFGAVLVSIGREYNFSASPCCILLKQDDAIALDWIDEHLPEDAYILIAGNTLNVFDIEETNELRSADGGVWIPLLTDRRVFVKYLGTDFNTVTVFNSLCVQGITHVYVGGSWEHFNLEGLQARPEWYTPQLTLPEAHIFKVEGCSLLGQ